MASRVESWHVGQLLIVLAIASVAEWLLYSLMSAFGGPAELVGVSSGDTAVKGGCLIMMLVVGGRALRLAWRWFGARSRRF